MATGTPITAAANGTTVVEVDPISRIEGHLGVKVTAPAGVITEADVHGNLWRGFENFLLGREVNDAITFTQRICGVCPVPHGMTSTYAADAVLGYSQNHITFADDGTYGVPAKAVYIRNIVLGSEFLMSSITHFYHLAAPSYVQGPPIPPWTPYFNTADYNALLTHGSKTLPTQTAGFSDDLWSAVITSYVTALRVRRLTFEAGALFAGRMPMTSCYVGGGVTNNYTTTELQARCDKFRDVMEEIGTFVVQQYVPIVLSLGALYGAWDNVNNAGGLGYGAGVGNFLAWGAFPNPADDTLTLPGGVWIGGAGAPNGPNLQFKVTNKATMLANFCGLSGPTTNSVPNNLKEDITNSRYKDTLNEFDTNNQAYPGAVTRTVPDRANGYTYSKAPRWNGNPCEVGPFARLVVAGYYPINGTALAATVPGYGAYTKTNSSAVSGLDPKMVAADIAVALVRESLATLTVGTTVINAAGLVGLSNSAIVAAYTDPQAVITGTIAGYIVGLNGGLSTLDRLRARGLESLVLVQAIIGAVDKSGAALAFGTGPSSGWIGALRGATGATWKDKPIPMATKQGWGATEAPRGALMHQCTITGGKITAYQCIVPTTWNMSPKDSAGPGPSGLRGPIEQAMIGVPYAGNLGSFPKQNGTTGTGQGGVEALRVAQSFDPCIACAVH